MLKLISHNLQISSCTVGSNLTVFTVKITHRLPHLVVTSHLTRKFWGSGSGAFLYWGFCGRGISALAFCLEIHKFICPIVGSQSKTSGRTKLCNQRYFWLSVYEKTQIDLALFYPHCIWCRFRSRALWKYKYRHVCTKLQHLHVVEHQVGVSWEYN